ncbi:S8 family serine peptidase [Actinomadura atramentaria]|uniref:S8 family serine peptidase n=1 Tax=Actinomadura atramentaria TaxID=1990 RepID=UPI00037921ED|nr:S8 family serine peptidase [Actinomadura atramentaria]
MIRLSRALRSFVAVCLTALPLLGPAVASAAAAAPRQEEWWFTTWSVQQKVWPVSKGAGVTVGVIDTGVDGQLPEFDGRLLPGWDTEGNGTDGRTDTDTQKDMFDKGGFGHGTGIAALIAANGARTGMIGLAPDARILPVAVRDISGYIAGMNWAVDHGASVINISAAWHGNHGEGRCSKDLQDAVDKALEHDVVVVVGSGNYAGRYFMEPGDCPGVLTVGAVGADIKPWSDSTRHPSVDLAAPGVQIGTLDRTGKVVRVNGTSASTAFVSAIVALVRSKYPQMSAREVVQRVLATAKDVGPAGKDEQTGYGLVMPYRALTAKVAADAPNPVYAEWDRHRAEAPAPTVSARPVAESESSAVFTPKRLALIGGGAVVLLAVVGGGAILIGRSRRRTGIG